MTGFARFWPRLVCACAVCCAGCGGDREPASAPPARGAAVDVEPPPAATPDHADRRTQIPRRRSESISTTSGELDIEVTFDGGEVNISSSSDGGVRVWGTFTRSDGGFSFQGGFSTSTGDAGP